MIRANASMMWRRTDVPLFVFWALKLLTVPLVCTAHSAFTAQAINQMFRVVSLGSFYSLGCLLIFVEQRASAEELIIVPRWGRTTFITAVGKAHRTDGYVIRCVREFEQEIITQKLLEISLFLAVRAGIFYADCDMCSALHRLFTVWLILVIPLEIAAMSLFFKHVLGRTRNIDGTLIYNELDEGTKDESKAETVVG